MADNRTSLDDVVATAHASATTDDVSGTLGVSESGIDLRDSEFIPISPNELGHLQKDAPIGSGIPQHDDPVGYGVGAWARPFGRLKYYLGKFRMDVLRWNNGQRHHTEVGFLKWAIDELVNNDGKPIPMFAVYLTESDEGSSDQGQQPVAIFTRRGIRLLVPVFVEAGIVGGGGGGGIPSAFQSDDGRYLYNVQGDPTPEYPYGRIVQYRRSDMKAVAILRPEALPL